MEVVKAALSNESLVADAISRGEWFEIIGTFDFNATTGMKDKLVVDLLPDHLFRDPELNLAMLLMAGCAPAR